ncbi:metal ABC transporter substrate-binding protein [Candidatus Binatia bacterium]|nr:metal ABC transporter substrate-binding protein [Candidatus Binatia bacterium]
MRRHAVSPIPAMKLSQRPLRRCVALVVLATCVCAATGSADAVADEGAIRVFATTPDLAALTREVGGDQVSLTVVVKGPEDPHHAEAKPSLIRALHDAELFVQNGLDLEAGYAPLLLQQARNPAVQPGSAGFLDASLVMGGALDRPTGVVDRSMGDLHPGGNPHYLLDPLRGIAVARAIASKLGDLRPASRATFDANFEAFQRRVWSALVGETLAVKYGPDVAKLALLFQHGKLGSFLEQQGERAALGGWLAALLPYVGAKAVDDHPIWAYFSDRFGLQVIGHLEPLPGVPPTTKHLEEIIGAMRADGVRIVLASAYYDPRYAQFVSDATKATVLRMANQVESVPAASSYVAMIDYDVGQVATALAAKP